MRSDRSGKWLRAVVAAALFCVISAAPANAQPPAEICGDGTTFTVNLPGRGLGIDDSDGWFRSVNVPSVAPADSITLPNGCRLYVLLVSGYHQNWTFDRLTFYKVAEFAAQNDGYVHVAWWNNLLAPYMARPLHPVTVTIDRFLLGDLVIPPNPGGYSPVHQLAGLFAPDNFLDLPKANPSSDDQFQSDAAAMITAIKANNPDALIVVVGHSMGGNAVARLGMNRDLPIDLLAPIDPVNNADLPRGLLTGRTFNWTRWRAAHQFRGYRQWDCVRNSLGLCRDFDDRLLHVEFRCAPTGPFLDRRPVIATRAPIACPRVMPYVDPGTRLGFGANIRHLYHRWQHEFTHPVDFATTERFNFPAALAPASNILGPNYQQPFLRGEPRSIFNLFGDPNKTCADPRDFDPRRPGFFCGPFEGHGEIVGFRAPQDDLLNPLATLDLPGLGLTGNWPTTPAGRRDALVRLATDGPSWPYRPTDPNTCMVCDDINTIVQHLLDQQPDPEPPADTTAPFTNAFADPGPNLTGWNADDVVITLSASDEAGGSGVKEIEYSLSGADTATAVITPGDTATVTITAEGTTTITFFSRDEAGNAEAPESLDIHIDRTAPTIDVTSPQAGGVYILNAVVHSAYLCSDGFSGLDTCEGGVVSGASLDTSAVGIRTFTVTATDLAGNQSTAEITYAVQYAFSGFSAPILPMPNVNPAQAGKAIVLKFSLADAAGAAVTNLDVLVSAESYGAACEAPPAGAAPPETVDIPVSQFTYNPNGGLFAFAWKTQAGWTGCRILHLTLRDGTVHSVLFSFGGSE